MAIARRVYLYLITLVALIMAVTGLAGLLQVALTLPLLRLLGAPVAVGASDLVAVLSISGALAALGLTAWAVHWWLAERPARRGGPAGEVERRSAIRALFLNLALLLGGLGLAVAAGGLLRDLARLALGDATGADIAAGAAVEPLSDLAVTGLFWLYYARIDRRDRRLAPEVGARATLRRWRVYLLSFVGLMLASAGAAGLLRTVWEALTVPAGAVATSPRWLPLALLTDAAWLAAGLGLWLSAWRWSNIWFARAEGPDPERRSVLRKVYLYLVIAVGVAWTAWNLGVILYRLLQPALRGDLANLASIVYNLGAPAALALVFGVVWRYHRAVIEREAALAGERGQQAAIRWLYQHLVALVGVAIASFGLARLLATALDLALQPAAVRPTTWGADQFSLAVTLLAVGLPLWLASWMPLQREAGADPAARRSPVRRVYLFLVFGLAVLTLLGSGVFALYQVLRLLLGEAWTTRQASETITAGSLALVAALQLAYHGRAARGDIAEPAPAEAAEAPVTLLALVQAPSAEAARAARGRLARLPAGATADVWETDAVTAARLRAEQTGSAREPAPESALT
jgi:hypothetical protein